MRWSSMRSSTAPASPVLPLHGSSGDETHGARADDALSTHGADNGRARPPDVDVSSARTTGALRRLPAVSRNSKTGRLQIATGSANGVAASTTQGPAISNFFDTDPKGFGLLRATGGSNYQEDLKLHITAGPLFLSSPSALGRGAVMLMELPTDTRPTTTSLPAGARVGLTRPARRCACPTACAASAARRSIPGRVVNTFAPRRSRAALPSPRRRKARSVGASPWISPGAISPITAPIPAGGGDCQRVERQGHGDVPRGERAYGGLRAAIDVTVSAPRARRTSGPSCGRRAVHCRRPGLILDRHVSVALQERAVPPDIPSDRPARGPRRPWPSNTPRSPSTGRSAAPSATPSAQPA